MKTRLAPEFADTAEGLEAQAIIAACVHCGFCTATCPTYQELQDERDGPRGRIYLMRHMLEGGDITDSTRTHLDRCLTCRSCETTCPSGVQYGRLVDIGRSIVEDKLRRPLNERLLRMALLRVLPYSRRFGVLLRIGQLFRPFLPRALKQKVPLRQQMASGLKSPESGTQADASSAKARRVMIALAGCAQPSATPRTNAAAARVLGRLGIQLVEAKSAGCCGAVSHHLSAHEEALDFMRRNIDAWWPLIEAGAETIVMTASGCGAMVQDYGKLLKDDSRYAQKAARVSSMMKDIGAVLLKEDLSSIPDLAGVKSRRLAVHCPCTLQHAMKQSGVMEQLLKKAGFELTTTRDGHLCCGSAGTYSILQPELSQKLLANKLEALSLGAPDAIVTANIGCQLHLGTKANVPVLHWIEVFDEALAGTATSVASNAAKSSFVRVE